MDYISLHNLRVACVIGDLEWEKSNPQNIRCDLKLGCDTKAAGNSDKLSDTIDYVEVGRDVVVFIQKSKFEMLEALAESLAKRIVKKYPVAEVILSLHKKAHFPNVEEVSITITRSPKDFD